MIQVLLVEDNPGDILLVQEALDQHRIEHKFHVCQDGEEALQFVERMGKPGELPCVDIILLDLNLTKVDGPEVLRQVRENPDCKHVPVIVISSADTPEHHHEVAELGISSYFKKPSDLDAYMTLGAVIRKAVESSPPNAR